MKIYRKALSESHAQDVVEKYQDRFDHIFGDKTRILIPLKDPTENQIKTLLADKTKTKSGSSYQVDLERKIAYKVKEDGTLDHRPMRLGKIVKSELGGEWSDKLSVAAAKSDSKNKAIVLSRSPIDVVRMSDHDLLRSCHSPGYYYFNNAIEESARGGAVAYVINEKELQEFIDKYGEDFLQQKEIFKDYDRDIDGIRPIARIRVNRYEDQYTSKELALPVTKEYGFSTAGFLDSLTNWLKDKQKDLIEDEDLDLNDYIRYGGAYADRSDRDIIKNFFGNDMGIYGDLESDAVGNRVDVWQEEINNMSQEINEQMRYCSISGEADISENMVYINAFMSVEFKFNGRFIGDPASVNIPFEDLMPSFHDYFSISDYYIDQNHGYFNVRCYVDSSKSFPNDPDEFRSMGESLLFYEERHHHEDSSTLYQYLLENAIVDAPHGITSIENYEPLELSPDEDEIIMPLSYHEGASNYSKAFIEELVEVAKEAFMSSLKRNINNYLNYEKQQLQFDFEGADNETDLFMSVAGEIPYFRIYLDTDNTFYVYIPLQEVHRLGSKYIKYLTMSKNNIAIDVRNAILNQIRSYDTKEEELSKESKMNWYALDKNRFVRLSFLDGEWWIDNGTALFADGDIGDMNHEAYVIEYARNMLADYDEDFESWKLSESKKVYDKLISETQDEEEKDDLMDSYNSDPEGFLIDNLDNTNIDQKLFFVANDNVGSNDVRLYAMKNWGWKRVQGKFVETYNLTSSDLESIYEGLYDAYSNDIDEMEERGGDIMFTIEVRSNNTMFHDIPYSMIANKNISNLMEYRERSLVM